MKAYFLPLGQEAEQALPAVLTALSCGAARQPETLTMLRIPASAPEGITDPLLKDLCACHDFFAGKDAFAFFRTAWKASCWLPDLPGREALVEGEESGLLLSALRGEGVPFSFRTDREAVEWSMSALLERIAPPPVTPAVSGFEDHFATDSTASSSLVPGEASPANPGLEQGLPDVSSVSCSDSALEPFLSLLSMLEKDLSAGEDVRLLLFCDLTEGYATGLAFSLLRFFRSRYMDHPPFLGLVGQARTRVLHAEADLSVLKSVLADLRNRNLVRTAEDQETLGADSCWLMGLPAALLSGKGALRLLDWASARVLGAAWTRPDRPGPGLHTREMPAIVTLHALDQEAKPAAAFLRGSLWCLSDLFPALHTWLDHPALLRSLAPATRGGLFRRLFRDRGESPAMPPELPMLERTLRAMTLEILSLLQGLPPLLREAEPSSDLWQQAVKACGRAVTLASEYDVRRQEAEDSGVDKVAPVHRDSLSDTAEEEMLRKLDQLSEELTALEADRSHLFEKTGGFLARLALEDCLAKCRVAETGAREKLILLPAGTPEERYALGLQERRVRLLQAAVARCQQDLAAATALSALRQPGAHRASGAFAGEIIAPSLAEHAFRMLTEEGDAALEAAKALREGLGGLLKGYALNDAKMLLKNLQSTCRQPEAEAPLRSLMAGVFSVCGVEVSGLRFQSAGQFPQLQLLPDLRGEEHFLTLSTAAERIIAPASEDRTAHLRGLLALMILRQYRRPGLGEASLRLIPLRPEASALLRVYLSSRGVKEATLVCLRKEADSESTPASPSEEKEVRPRLLPLAVMLPGRGLEPARVQVSQLDLIPSFASWLDREAPAFLDPCAFLSEGDRQILTEQLTRLRAHLRTPASHALVDFLSDWHRDIMQSPRQEQDPESLRRRLRVACALPRLPVWQKDLRRVSIFFESSLPGDPICAALLGEQFLEAATCKAREDVLYVFRSVPLAREDARRLLSATHAPHEEHLLASLQAECSLLLQSSDDYHEALTAGLEALMRRFPSADPDALSIAEAVLAEAQAPVQDRVTELSWPWDTVSSSVLTILTECLGPDLAPAALHAFSDRLALCPARGGEILGDRLFSSLCLVPRELPGGDTAPDQPDADAFPDPEAAPQAQSPVPSAAPGGQSAFFTPLSEEGQAIQPESCGEEASIQARSDAVLPPLGADFARALLRTAQGQSLIQPGFLRFVPEGEGIRVEMTLEGAFSLKLIRVYAKEEICSLYAHDLPTLALWPALPFPQDSWHAYFSYAHCTPHFTFTALSAGEEVSFSGNRPRLSAVTRQFPLCFLVEYQGQGIGAVPNLLPPPEVPPSPLREDWTACLDFGASALSLIFSDGLSRWPLQGPVTVRTLLRSPAVSDSLLWREFLPAVPVSALLPGALRIFRHELGESDLPLRDGAIFFSASLRDVLDIPSEALYTDLKWSEEKGRATRLYLHQAMLLAALQARCSGAGSLSWRFALPDEMAPEGRERLAETLRALSEEVSKESGLPLPDRQIPVAFASESAALGAYVRFCAPEQARGGFLALDLGADTADLSLYLQGREEAVRACQLPLGLHNLLLPELLNHPTLLREDFGFVDQPSFQRDLEDLQQLLDRARRDPAALRQARCGLDAILADHLPLFIQALRERRAGGQPGRIGALILLQESFLMMASGLCLLQIAGDSLRNDTLPESMTLFLAGRGSLLAEALSDSAKTSLWRMLTMFRNPRVYSLSLLFSAEKKLEIPVGLSLLSHPTASLPHPAPAPAAIAVRPEELMPEFLLRFRREFPEEAELLFPGMFAHDYFTPFTPLGQQLLAQALQASFDRREPGKPFPALVSFLHHLLSMAKEGGASLS